MGNGNGRMTHEALGALARRLRVQSVRMTHAARSSHVGSCLSAADLLAVLYGNILRVDPANPEWPDRDRYVQSKGHASAVLYATLAERGFFPVDQLDTFCQNGSTLLGHVTRGAVPGIDLSTGALGHGLAVSTGMALAAKRAGQPSRVFCLLSDGECDEGSTWEAALLAAHHGLDNLIAIVDYNKIQSLGSVEETLKLEPFVEKWRSFGWAVREIDGHDIAAIEETLTGVPFAAGRPSCVMAHTVKGKGVSFMEGTVLWHYRTAQGEELDRAIAELEAAGR